MTSTELFLAVSHGGAVQLVGWPKHVGPGVGLILPKYPFYLLASQLRSLQCLSEVHSQVPWGHYPTDQCDTTSATLPPPVPFATTETLSYISTKQNVTCLPPRFCAT